MWKYTKKDAKKRFDETFPERSSSSSQFSDFYQAVPYGEDRVILFTGLGTHLLNVENHSCERIENLSASAVAIQGDLLLLNYAPIISFSLDLYDTKTFTLLKSIDLSQFKSEEYNQYPKMNTLQLSPDGKYAVFSLRTDVISEYYDKNYGSGTYLLNLETDQITLISTDSSEQIEFLDNNRIGLFLNHTSAYDSKYRLDDMRIRTYTAAIYEISSGEMSFQRILSDNITATTNIRKINLTIEEQQIEAVAFALNGELSLYDLKKKKIIVNFHFHNYIADVFEDTENHFFITLENGSTHLVSLVEGSFDGNGIYNNRLLCDLDTEIKSALYLWEEDAFLFFQNHKVIYATLKSDEHYKKIQMPEDTDLTQDSVEYAGKNPMYRIITFQNKEYDNTAFSVYPVGKADPIYHWKTDSDGSIFAKYFWMQKDRFIAAIVECDKSQLYSYQLHILDVTNQKELCTMPISDFYGGISSMVFSEKENRIYISNHGTEYRKGISVFEFQEDQLVNVQYDFCAENRIDFITLSGSGDSILILGREENDSSTPMVSVYHFDTKEMSNVGFDSEEIIFGFDTSSITSAENTAMIFLKTTDQKPYLVDLDQPENPIFIDETINRSAVFFDHDRYLLFGKDETLCLYDIEKSKIISTYRNDKLLPQAFHFRYFTPSEDGSYFALNQGDGYFTDLSNDQGFYIGKMYLFYVDENHKIYLYADSSFTSMSPDAKEIYTSLAYGSFAPLYSYQDLLEEAEKKLEGKTLTEDDLKSYINSEE